jgi:hypothetical protein
MCDRVHAREREREMDVLSSASLCMLEREIEAFFRGLC